MQKNILYAIIAALFILPFIPFFVPSTFFFPFIVGKAFLFRVVVEVIVGAWILLFLKDARYAPRITPITILFGVFVGVMLVADLLGVNVSRSLWSNFERMEGWVTLIHLFGLFLALQSVFSVQKLWNRWIQTSLGASVLISLYGFLQVAGVLVIHQGGVRLDATFGNATYLAVYALFHAFFAVLLFTKTRLMWLRSVYVGIAALNTVILYLTATRGAILGLGIGALVAAGLYAVLTRNKKAVASAVAVFVVLISLSGILVLNKDQQFVTSSPVLSRVASISLEAGKTRFAIWNIAWQGFLDRPVLGYGQGNFGVVFGKYYTPDLYNQEPWFDRAHNIFFDWLIAGGAVGALTYFGLFFLTLYVVLRSKRSPAERAILAGLLIGYLIHNLFVFDNLMSYILYTFVLAYVSSESREWWKLQFSTVSESATNSAIALAVVAVVLYGVNVPAFAANRELLQGLQSKDPLARFTKALSYHSFGDQEIREQMVQFAIRVSNNPQVPITDKRKVAQQVAGEMAKQAAISKFDPRVQLLYGSVLNLAGDNTKAKEVLNYALTLAPEKQALHFERANAELALGENKQALADLQQAYNSAPGYTVAARVYGTTLIRLGKKEAGEKILRAHFGDSWFKDDATLSALFAAGARDEFIKLWTRRVNEEGRTRDGLVQLARAYFIVGDKGNAINAIQEAIVKDPSFEAQGNMFIESIKKSL